MDEKIKILIAYHKKACLVQNDVLTPIHVGRALHSSEWLENNMIGDNSGDNISDKNNRYCELTAQYFAWKNPEKLDNPDYIGFLHYRRLMNFNTNVEYPLNRLGQIVYIQQRATGQFYEKFGLDKDSITNLVKEYDLVTVDRFDLIRDNAKTVYKHYKACHNIKDYDIAIKVLLKKYPEFKNAVETYNNSQFAYFTNCFVMKTELFNQYAEWMFSILFEAEKSIKNRAKDSYDRVMGYIAERLFGIYVTYLKQNGYKIKELRPIFLDLADINKKVIPVVFACNNNYAQHLCCSITSILKNAIPEEYFYFYIINTKKNLNYLNKKMISRLANENCKIEYVTIDDKAEMFRDLPLTQACAHISIEAYYRYLLPTIFPYYDKILYLDCDTNVQSDLSPLYDMEMGEYYWLGVKDLLADSNCERLQVNKYCNSGVMLVNLKKWRENDIQNKLFEYTNMNADKIKWPDQDVLNVILQDGILYIDKKWNAQVGEYDACYTTGFNEIGKSAAIIHHVGCVKPWSLKSKSPFRDVYFEYLKYTRWECRFVAYYVNKLKALFKQIIQLLKEFRQYFIWYDKRNSQIVFLKKYSLKVKL